MQGRRRRLLLNDRDHLCTRAGFGLAGTTDGTVAGMSGYLDIGLTRLDGELCGSPAAGCLAAGAMSGSPERGGNAY
jgi:hypothetical protein